MIKSLLLKLGMLSLTIGVVFWVRWTPQPPIQGTLSATEKQFVASQATELEERDRRVTGSFSQSVKIDTVAQTRLSQPPISSRLDLNRASASELESLPGIGTVLAQRVIEFRESVGRFQKIEDLREVKGIGVKKFERLKSFVIVSDANS